MLHDERTYSPSFAYFWDFGLISILLCVWIMNLMFNRLILASWWEDVFSFICSCFGFQLEFCSLMCLGIITLWFNSAVIFVSVNCVFTLWYSRIFWIHRFWNNSFIFLSSNRYKIRSKTNLGDIKTTSSISIFIVVGLCCFFYILCAW